MLCFAFASSKQDVCVLMGAFSQGEWWGRKRGAWLEGSGSFIPAYKNYFSQHKMTYSRETYVIHNSTSVY